MDIIKGAVVYLLNNSEEDKNDFKSSLDGLIKFYLKKYPCDVICFHEKNFCIDELQYLKNTYEVNLIFQEIDFKIPNYEEEIIKKIPEYFPHPQDPNNIGFPMGYRHMCRFFAGDIFNQSILNNYRYIWRLDTDSKILSEIESDIFYEMSRNKAVYGYINIQHDHPAVIKDLWETSEKYFRKINKSKIFDENKDFHYRRVFYTNFEVLDLEWFKSNEYQSFYNYLDATAGIYIHRWGDHIIRYIALNSLESKNKFLFFKDIVYQHGEIYHNREIINTY